MNLKSTLVHSLEASNPYAIDFKLNKGKVVAVIVTRESK
jgi:hypothetical protein